MSLTARLIENAPSSFVLLSEEVSDEARTARSLGRIVAVRRLPQTPPISAHMRYLVRYNGPPILPERGIHFSTVTPPNMGQRPTFGPESSLLWESSAPTVAQSACRPTAVPKWIPLLPDMGGGSARGSRGRGRIPVRRGRFADRYRVATIWAWTSSPSSSIR